uniref:Uncharacterized protein n=1 Tax=viral metagenome TaxID=1070528 RepID=A0A6H1ZC60_9ZZZZ
MFKLLRNPGVLAALSAAGGMVGAANDIRDRDRQSIEKERDYQQQYARQLGVMDYSQQQQQDAGDRSFNRDLAVRNYQTLLKTDPSAAGQAARGLPDQGINQATAQTMENAAASQFLDQQNQRGAWAPKEDPEKEQLRQQLAQMRAAAMQLQERAITALTAGDLGTVKTVLGQLRPIAADEEVADIYLKLSDRLVRAEKEKKEESKVVKNTEQEQQDNITIRARQKEYNRRQAELEKKGESMTATEARGWKTTIEDPEEGSGLVDSEAWANDPFKTELYETIDFLSNEYKRSSDPRQPVMGSAVGRKQIRADSTAAAQRIAPPVPRGQMFAPGADIDIIATPEGRHNIQQNATGGMDTTAAQPAAQPLPVTSGATTAQLGIQSAISNRPSPADIQQWMSRYGTAFRAKTGRVPTEEDAIQALTQNSLR